MTEFTDRPNPGALEAATLGCTCPVIDNNYGQFAPWPPNGWWITDGCPLHDLRGDDQFKKLTQLTLEDENGHRDSHPRS